MSDSTHNKMIVALDIGTSKVVAMIGEIDSDDNIKVIGIGSHVSRGLKRGVVVDIELTVHSVQKNRIKKVRVKLLPVST